MNSIETVFEWLLTATLRASVLAVVILGLQFVLRRWLPAAWRHALWLPMLAVLLLPAMIETPFAVLPQITTSSAPSVVVTSEKSTTIVSPAVSPVPEISEAAELTIIAEEVSLPVAATPIVAAAPILPPATSKLSIFAIVWLVGACGMFLMGLIGYRRNMRRINSNASAPDRVLLANIADAASEAGLKRAPHALISPDVASPAVTGFSRPVLLLPAGFPEGFSPTEARLILLHEFTHLKRYDLPLNWLMCVLQAMHWFNPLLWFAFARMRADREMACDAQVLSIDATDRRAEYGGALLKLQCVAPSRALSLGFVGIFEHGSEIKSRIREISAYRPGRLVKQIAGGALFSLLMVIGITKAQQVAPVADETSIAKVSVGAAAATEKDPTLLAMLDALKKSDAESMSKLLTDVSPEQATAMIKRIAAKWGDLSKLEITTEALPERFHKGNMEVVEQWGKEATDTGKWMKLRSEAAPNRWLQLGLLYAKNDPQPRQFLAVEWSDQPNKEVDPANAAVRDKLHSIIIPILDFEDVSLEEAVDYLRARSQQLDIGEKDSAKKGFNFVVNYAPQKAGEEAAKEPTIKELRLKNVPLSMALKYICAQINYSYEVDDTIIVISPKQQVAAQPTVPVDAAQTALTVEKLKTMIIPQIDFNKVTIDEAIEFLRVRSVELDATEKDAAKKGINFVVGYQAAEAVPMIRELRLTNVPMATGLKYICEQSKLRYTVEGNAVIIMP